MFLFIIITFKTSLSQSFKKISATEKIIIILYENVYFNFKKILFFQSLKQIFKLKLVQKRQVPNPTICKSKIYFEISLFLLKIGNNWQRHFNCIQ